MNYVYIQYIQEALSVLHLASLLMVQHTDWFALYTHLDANIDITHAAHIKSFFRMLNSLQYI